MQSILSANTEAGGNKVLQLLHRKQVFGIEVDTKPMGNPCATKSQIEHLLILEWGCLSGQSHGACLKSLNSKCPAAACRTSEHYRCELRSSAKLL